jgi:hypothetical protein
LRSKFGITTYSLAIIIIAVIIPGIAAILANIMYWKDNFIDYKNRGYILDEQSNHNSNSIIILHNTDLVII